MKARMFNWMLIGMFVLSGMGHFLEWSMVLNFFLSAAAIVFLAAFLGKATENVAFYAGERVGGFLNATFGNATELIIAIFLVKANMFDMVKASLTGSIIGNLLFVLGLSLLLGGFKFKEQSFNLTLANMDGSLMVLAVIALFVPAVFFNTHAISDEATKTLSLIVAGLLITAYILWLIFSMVTHKELLAEEAKEVSGEAEQPDWSKRTSILMLVIATVMVAFASEWLVDTLDTFSTQFGWSELFIGAFVIAIVGNAAEHAAAVILAMKNKVGASIEIAIGSSLQIALFVAPMLVFVSAAFGNTMDFVFSVLEIVAIGVAVFIAKSISQDGRSNWYKGLMLLIVYLILGASFYLVP
ncbi:calcium/proton exchanger [Paenibacillus sp. ACRRX]|uniref:calcium/proton exchanger n=1 Tax=unclassified Paenibacillus TaxID=185978 RepID=UPI001EF70240|nr:MULTISPECIES: calcium/proton exchanger [unclassified Paenibacillus]MCG7407626.1 calcium/proton exchanger [Paenibacillus sp. ACRRX]MDK8180861.1 calcium/proton exchanger [Paenibacillus sp. UMB4589-SE434]